MSCALAALAAAYGSRPTDARLLNHKAARASCPSVLAAHHYVAGEIDNLDHAWSAAEHHYREAMQLCELSGTAFIGALARVGLVSVHASAGDTEAALRGYGELIDYWERTGGWTQQWTTLRNLADLLDQLGDRDCAALLRRAADEAPEAASIADVAALAPSPDGDDRIPTPRARPPGSEREHALHTARSAIARHLKASGG